MGEEIETLLSKDSIINDLKINYKELAKFGIKPADASWYLPPYEWLTLELIYRKYTRINCNQLHSGTATPADYTTPDMKSYKSSAELIGKLFAFEKSNSLNGAIILIHPGVESSRTDKLYNRLDEIVLN